VSTHFPLTNYFLVGLLAFSSVNSVLKYVNLPVRSNLRIVDHVLHPYKITGEFIIWCIVMCTV